MPDLPERQNLADLQRQFAAHIRDPEHHAAPAGIEDRRMQIYRELFFNNISSLLAGNFPVLRALHDDDAWAALVRDFYAGHRCGTPLFPEVPREFLRYLQDSRAPRPEDPPFLLELAHYEWTELALSLDERELSDVPAIADGDLLDGYPALSPLAWPLSYRYPVHRIRPDYRPQEPPAEATHLLVYRDRTDTVRFMQLNVVTRLLLELLREDCGSSGRAALLSVAQRIAHPHPDRVLQAGARALEDLRARDVLLGSRPA